jgi:purine nucleosidase
MYDGTQYHDQQASQLNIPKHMVLIDTDIGDDIDDALALALALSSPEIDLLGISTVFGDTTLRAKLALYLLHTYGRDDILVAAGEGIPLQYRHRPSGVAQAAVLTDLPPSESISKVSEQTGPQLIIETALAHYGLITLLCLGPLTNVATALRMEPQLFMAIRRVIMMGGTSGLPFPEWNIRSDAKAAQIVLASGIPITLIGWNVTKQCHLPERDIAQLRERGTPQTDLVSRLVAIWQAHRPGRHPALPFLHDPLTVVALCQPALLQFEGMAVRVPVSGPFKGFMIPRLLNGPLAQAAVGVQAEEARIWIMQRLLAPLPR